MATTKTYVRKKDDPSLFLHEIFVEGDEERAVWGPLDEDAWVLDPDDFPSDMADEHGGVVVKLAVGDSLFGGAK